MLYLLPPIFAQDSGSCLQIDSKSASLLALQAATDLSTNQQPSITAKYQRLTPTFTLLSAELAHF